MKRTFAWAALAAPWAAYAAPSSEAVDVIDIEYWGTVTEAIRTPERSIGDFIYGRMRIDTRVPVSDGEWFLPHWAGEYDVYPGCSRTCPRPSSERSGFVTSPGITDRGGGVFDRVWVIDSDVDPSAGFPSDTFVVRDWEQSNQGPPYDFDSLSIEVSSPVNFIMGNSLVQSFDLELEESGGTATGESQSVRNGLGSLFSFVIDRIRATPRVCRP